MAQEKRKGEELKANVAELVAGAIKQNWVWPSEGCNDMPSVQESVEALCEEISKREEQIRQNKVELASQMDLFTDEVEGMQNKLEEQVNMIRSLQAENEQLKRSGEVINMAQCSIQHLVALLSSQNPAIQVICKNLQGLFSQPPYSWPAHSQSIVNALQLITLQLSLDESDYVDESQTVRLKESPTSTPERGNQKAEQQAFSGHTTGGSGVNQFYTNSSRSALNNHPSQNQNPPQPGNLAQLFKSQPLLPVKGRLLELKSKLQDQPIYSQSSSHKNIIGFSNSKH